MIYYNTKKDYTIKIDLYITEDELQYSLTKLSNNNDQNFIEIDDENISTIIKLSDLENRSDFSEGLYAIIKKSNDRNPTYDKVQIFNLYSFSYTARRPQHQTLSHFFNQSFPVKFYYPFKGAKFTEMPFIVRAKEFSCNLPVIELNHSEIRKIRHSFFPKFNIIGPDTVNSQTKYIITVDHDYRNDAVFEIDIQSTTGYVAKRRMNVSKQNPAEVWVMPLGLVPNDIIDLKVGLKYWSNLSHKEIMVV